MSMLSLNVNYCLEKVSGWTSPSSPLSDYCDTQKPVDGIITSQRAKDVKKRWKAGRRDNHFPAGKRRKKTLKRRQVGLLKQHWKNIVFVTCFNVTISTYFQRQTLTLFQRNISSLAQHLASILFQRHIYTLSQRHAAALLQRHIYTLVRSIRLSNPGR